MDLETLANGFGLADGVDEVTTWPLFASEFEPYETVELEYIGALSRPRGEQVGVDCDEAVADLLLAGMSVAQAFGRLH